MKRRQLIFDRLFRFSAIAWLAFVGMACREYQTPALAAPNLWQEQGALSEQRDPSDPNAAPTFAHAAAPFLARYCVACHQGAGAEAGLDLTRREGWLAGGDSGSLLEPVNRAAADQSPIPASLTRIGSRIASHEMPPADVQPQPQPSEIELFFAWLDAEAAWPDGEVVDELAVTTEHRAGRDWWSLQPLNLLPSPQLQDGRSETSAHAPRGSIDAWLEVARQQRGLTGQPLADRRTLLIRAAIDLQGLAPDEHAIREFVNDQRPDAFERQIDRLLASPALGQRWGRHWLDVARYGDTHGYERDFPRAHAWRYRDWVIDSINSDLPYDQFVRWQLAGDVDSTAPQEAVLAAGFLAAGPYDVTGLAETPSPALKRMARAEELDDMVATSANAFLGLTLQCARCHSHKVDPISQHDYYQFASLLSGVHRGDVSILPREARAAREAERAALRKRLDQIDDRLAALDERIDLAQVVAGGDGRRHLSGDLAVDPRSGEFEPEKIGMLEGIKVNQFLPGVSRYIDGVSIPDASATEDGRVIISSSGLTTQVADTTGASWDYIRSGPVHSQAFTESEGIDYATEGHSMLGMHANKLITFDLHALRRSDNRTWEFRGIVAYGGKEETTRAEVMILVDGELRYHEPQLTRAAGPQKLGIELPADARFLTLIATDGGDGLSHDQVFFGDPWLLPKEEQSGEEREREKLQLSSERDQVRIALDALDGEPQMYGVVSRAPERIAIAIRGDTEQLGEEVEPGFLSCLPHSVSWPGMDASDADRRRALAQWLVTDAQHLIARVAVNRLWQHHFGNGLVRTSSDFGFNGDRPTHGKLLDHLAQELIDAQWSTKWLHRKMITSAAWQQSSNYSQANGAIDQDNRWLWRYSPKRLEAEAIRDRILQTAGTIDLRMAGPGYRDFEFEERYAPIYRHRSTDAAPYWRRSIYRFAVRSVPEPLMEALDCPNPSTTAPQRNETTTAVQALAMLNGTFLLQQANRFASRLEHESPDDLSTQVRNAFELALLRAPSDEEWTWGVQVAEQSGLRTLCRALLNANEFLYVE